MYIINKVSNLIQRFLFPNAADSSSLQELASHIHSISSEESIILLTFKTFDEIWKFTTYYSLGKKIST